MATDEQNYRAETTKIAGLALLTSLGRVMLDPLPLFHSYSFLEIVFYAIYALGLAFLGLVCIFKGHDILYGKKR